MPRLLLGLPVPVCRSREMQLSQNSEIATTAIPLNVQSIPFAALRRWLPLSLEGEICTQANHKNGGCCCCTLCGQLHLVFPDRLPNGVCLVGPSLEVELCLTGVVHKRVVKSGCKTNVIRTQTHPYYKNYVRLSHRLTA